MAGVLVWRGKVWRCPLDSTRLVNQVWPKRAPYTTPPVPVGPADEPSLTRPDPSLTGPLANYLANLIEANAQYRVPAAFSRLREVPLTVTRVLCLDLVETTACGCQGS